MLGWDPRIRAAREAHMGDRPETLLLCPGDGLHLKRIDYKGIEIDPCPRCGGFWFDAGEVEFLRRLEPSGPPRVVGLSEEVSLQEDSWWSGKAEVLGEIAGDVSLDTLLDCVLGTVGSLFD